MDQGADLGVLVFKANSEDSDSSSRVAIIKQIQERIVSIELLMRLCKDLGQLKIKHFSSACEILESLGKQATGWLKSSSARAELIKS